MPALTPPPPAALASDTPTVFDQKAYARVQWEAQNVAEQNVLQADLTAKFNYVAAAYAPAGGVAAAITTAAAYAQQAVAAAALAASAAVAVAAPYETLAPVSTASHVGAVLRGLVADLGRDWDPSWTKRCRALSYTQEQLCGTWLGIQPSEIAARSYGATLGIELMGNGGFDTDVAGWNASGAGGSIAWNAGKMRVIRGSADTCGVRQVATVAGKTYRVSFDAANVAGNGWIAYAGSSPGFADIGQSGAVNSGASQGQSFAFTAGGANTYISCYTYGTGGMVDFDNISVREVLSTNRVGMVNLAPWSQDFTNAGWGKAGGITAPSANTVNFPNLSEAIATTVAMAAPVGASATAAFVLSGTGTIYVGCCRVGTGPYEDAKVKVTLTSTPTLYTVPLTITNAGQTGFSPFLSRSTDGTATTVTVGAGGLFAGVFTTSQILASGIPLTKGAPACAPGGDYYQNSGDGKFYAIGALGGQAEVTRGNKAEFPAIPDFKSEAQRLVVYDLSQPGAPMWMSLPYAGSGVTGNLFPFVNATACGMAYLNGQLWIGFGAAGTGLVCIDFAKDESFYLFSGPTANTGRYRGNIAQRNAGLGHDATNRWQIVGDQVNDITLTVLPDAPADAVTGLPVPTVTISTGRGMSVITHDGLVNNFSDQALPNTRAYSSGYIDANRRLIAYNTQNGSVHVWNNATSGSGSITVSAKYEASGASFPSIPAGMSRLIKAQDAAFVVAGSSGLTLIKENPSAPTLGMAATITKDYNTGWCDGDTRLAMADTVAETVGPTTELFANAEFATDIAGASDFSTGGAISWDASGALKLTPTTAYATARLSSVTLIPGKTYQVRIKNTGTAAVNVFGGDVAGQSNYFNITAAPGQPATAQFVANTASMFGTAGTNAAGYALLDLYSVKQIEADRSVRANGLQVVGTLQKTPVALGAQLVAWTGFGSGNYMTQPANTALDFAGDFATVQWVNQASSDAFSRTILRRGGSSNATPFFDIRKTAADLNVFRISDGTNTVSVTSSAAVVGQYVCLVAVRRGLNIELWQNAVLQGTVSAASVGSLANAAAVLNVGYDPLDAFYVGAVTLPRIMATAPSADDIAKIYRDELPRFQAGAQDTLAGNSNSVVALAYDDVTNTTIATTPWGSSYFVGQVRVGTDVSNVGTPTSVSAINGIVSTAGSAGARVYMPPVNLRDEFRRKLEMRQAGAKQPIPLEFTVAGFTSPTTLNSNALVMSNIKGTPAVGMGVGGVGIPVGTTITEVNGANVKISNVATATAGSVTVYQNVFPLGIGVEVALMGRAVKVGGTYKRFGGSWDYLIADSGYRQSVVFGSALAPDSWLQIEWVRK